MAITVGDKTYRNLPEQVEENANNIENILAIISSMGNVMRYKGSVPTYAYLPTEDNQIGDVWNILDTGNNYAWDGENWDEISSYVDLSGYAQKAGIAREYDATLTYAVGDIVYHENNLYKCNTAIATPEAWDVTHWTQIILSEETVTLSKEQTITGIKTFDNDIKISTVGRISYDSLYLKLQIGTTTKLGIGANITYCATKFRPSGNPATLDLGDSQYTWRDLYLGGAVNFNGTSNRIESPNASFLDIYQGNSRRFAVGSTTYVYCHFVPSGSRDLGSATLQWHNFYISGNLTDGTNSVTVAQLAQNILYKHTIVTDVVTIEIITNDKTALTSLNDIESLFDDSIRASYITGGRKFRIETILSGYIYYIAGVGIQDQSIGNLVSDTVTQY